MGIFFLGGTFTQSIIISFFVINLQAEDRRRRYYRYQHNIGIIKLMIVITNKGFGCS